MKHEMSAAMTYFLSETDTLLRCIKVLSLQDIKVSGKKLYPHVDSTLILDADIVHYLFEFFFILSF